MFAVFIDRAYGDRGLNGYDTVRLYQIKKQKRLVIKGSAILFSVF